MRFRRAYFRQCPSPRTRSSEAIPGFAPRPDADVHWFRVELSVHRTGWAYVRAGVPLPSVEWVAEELTHQQAALGRALEGILVSSGFHLARAPRADSAP